MAKIVIVGMGAMGSVYAGLMSDAGHEVHGVCRWSDHVAAARSNGLRVRGVSGDRTVTLASVGETTDGIGAADVVVIATKAFDVVAAAEAAKAVIGPGTVIQTIQNGLGSADKVAAVLGGDRLVIGVVGGFGASVPEPGVAHHNGMEMIRFGSYGALPRRELSQAAEAWTSSGFDVRLFDDTAQMVWEKLIMNVAFSGTCTLTELTIGGVLEDSDAWSVASACSLEAVEVSRAAGIALDVGDPLTHVAHLGGKIPNARPSMLIDASLRRRGEVDAINGSICQWGRRYGVGTPVNDSVVRLIRARESAYVPRG